MYYLNWNVNSKEMFVSELSEMMYDESGIAETITKRTYGAPRPIYAGFFEGMVLVMEIPDTNGAEITFWGKNNWAHDEDLKKFLVLFYVEKGIYPSFKEDGRKLIMRLSKI